MLRSCTARPRWRTVLLAAALALLPASLLAQAGTVRGTVAGSEGAALAGAQVVLVGPRLSAVTTAQGAFVLADVPAGTHQLRVSHAGYRVFTRQVEVRAGEEALLAVALTPTPVLLDGVVVSASRRAERVTEAPVTITRIGPEVLENTVGNSFVGALKQAKGLDFIQVGATSVAVNARGFNSSFNNRMLMMEDGRIAVLPENGLPVGQFTATPKVDLAGLEVIVGPGAALYGADASSGVLTLRTKDPREFPGTTVEVTAGNRAYKDVQLRQAGVFGGSWGYKVAGEFQDADDWSNQLTYGANKETGVGGEVDWTSRVSRGTGSLVRYLGEDGRLEVSGGMSVSDGVGQTNVGRNQLVGWKYNFAQVRLDLPNWYFTAYRTQSQSGESYALNRFTDNKFAAANRGMSDEELRLMSDWPSDGQLYAAEAQNHFRLPSLLDTRVVWGAQLRRDVVSSDRQWLGDRLTGEDLTIGQYGVYAQTETRLLPQLQLLLAGRYDNHDRYEPQFSPKAGLVFNPVQGHSVRATYNRAFKSPTVLQTDFYIPDFSVLTPTIRVGVFGNTDGFTTRATNGAETHYAPVVPEENQTWELGYKGVFAGRLFVDVTGYRSRYENFLSPLTNIGAAFRNGSLVTNEAGNPQLVFTYFNLGDARLRGVDAGVNYVLNPKVDFAATYSYTDLQSIENVDVKLTSGAPDTAKIRELSSLNSPTSKWSLGANFRDLREWRGGLTLRRVGEYFFASGINKGTIPTFTTVDANLGYHVRRLNTTLTLGVSNLFGCRNADAAEPGDADECGFGIEHREMVNMPRIGTMVFLGGRYHLQ